MLTMDKKRRGAYLYLTGAMFISGSAVVVSKMMVGELPMFLATELGIVIGLICLIPACFLISRQSLVPDVRSNLVMLLQAFCGVFLYRLLTFWGLRYTSAADSGLITSSGPVFVAVLAFFFLREALNRYRVLGLLMVFAGLLIINFLPFWTGTAAGAHSVRGNLLILGAVVCEAIFSVLSKVKCVPMTALYRTTVITFYAFVLLLPFSIYDAVRYDWGRFSVSSLQCVIYYGIFVSFLSYVLWFKGIEKTEASGAAVFTSVVPVSSIVLSALLLKEEITAVHIVGLISIFAGILISTHTPAKRMEAETPLP